MFHLILNAYWEPLEFELPNTGDKHDNGWRRWIDTALDSPQDIEEWETAPFVAGRSYRSHAHSLIVLFARKASQS